MTDQQLLLRIQQQDAEALSMLYDRYNRLIYGFLLGMLKDTDEAEDALQDVFVLVWKKSASYRDALGNPKNWMVRIAHNRAVNILKSRRIKIRQSEISIPEESESSSHKVALELSDDSLSDDMIRREESGILGESLSILPEDQRYLIELAFFQGYSHSEIAEATQIALGTVKTRIRAGLQALRSHLASMRNELT